MSILTGSNASPLLAENYRYLQDFVQQNSGIVLDGSKQYLVESRLNPIARAHGLGSINDLCNLMRATRDAKVQRAVVEAMTTNETYFFRDPAQYEAIRTALLPELRQRQRIPSFWSAAASTGQEAYSLAMLLAENGFGEGQARITGTDLNEQVLAKARAGRYQQLEVNRGLPAPLLVKYFTRHGMEWQLADRIRRMVSFETLDLRNRPRQGGPFDLVFCRNVLIYFDTPTRKKIIEHLRSTLSNGGWLVLGSTEVPVGTENLFDRRSIGAVSVYVAR